MSAAAAAYTHMSVAEAGFMIVELMQDLIAHAVSGSASDFTLSGHLVETCDLTGSCNPASFADFRIISVADVSRREAGAGRAGDCAAAAGDTALVEFLPHRMALQGKTDVSV